MPDEQTTNVDQVTPVSPVVDATPPVPEKIALSPWLEAVRRPIPGANPCGKDVSYDDDFLAVKAEIDKLSTVGGGVDQERVAELRQMMDATRGAVKKADKTEAEKQLEQRSSVAADSGGIDYEMIKEKSVKVLAEKSKDIRIASYLCFALWRKEKFSGLSEGLSAIDILVSEFWDGLYPAKTRIAGRKSAIDFLSSKLVDNVEYAPVTADDRIPLERAKSTLASLQKHFAAKIPDSPPSLLGLSQAVEKCLSRIPKPTPAPKTAAPETTSGSVPATQAPAGSQPEVASSSLSSPVPSGELRSNQEAVDVVKKAAKFLRDQNRKNPTPYRLVRSIRWDSVVAVLPNENGKTKLEAPALPRRNYLIGLRDAGDWNKLLDECELSFGQPGIHLWLDMQRISVAALDGLGGEFSNVRTAVLTELAVLLQRVPKLSSLTFGDGTRFADPPTADWIEETVMPVLGSSGSSAPGLSARFGDGELDNQYVAARKILDGGDLAGAITLLQGGANNDNSRKAVFRRKLAMASLCMRGSQSAIARPMLENLSEDIEKFLIDEWEPALTLEVWTNLHKCYETLAAGPATPNKQTIQQLAEKVFEKICRLDVGYALASTGTKPKTKAAPFSSKPDALPGNAVEAPTGSNQSG